MRKIAILLMFTFIISSTMAEGKVFVLAFHTFLDKEKIDLDIGAKELRQELESLKNQGFKFVTMEDVKKNKIIGNKKLLMTDIKLL